MKLYLALAFALAPVFLIKTEGAAWAKTDVFENKIKRRNFLKKKFVQKPAAAVPGNKHKVKSLKQDDAPEYDLERDVVYYDCSVDGEAVATNIETLISANFGALEGYEGSDMEGAQCISDATCCPGYHCCRLGRCQSGPEDMLQCEPVKPDGEFCTTGGECETRICANNVCGTESSDEDIIEAQCESLGQTLWSEALSEVFGGQMDCFEDDHCCNNVPCTSYACEAGEGSRLKSKKYMKEIAVSKTKHNIKSVKQEAEFDCSDPDQAVKTNIGNFDLNLGELTEEPQCLSDESCCSGYFCCNSGMQPCEDASDMFKCERTKQNGDTCTYGGACESGMCINELCSDGSIDTEDLPDLSNLDLESCESTGKTVQGALLSSLGLIQCGVNEHCCPGEQCCRRGDCQNPNDSIGFKCEPFVATGSECRHDSACEHGRCVEGFGAFGHSTGYKCRAPALGLGEPCHEGADCDTGLGCSAGDHTCQNECEVRVNMDSEECAEGQRCGRGWNSYFIANLYGVCEPKEPLGTSCDFDSECASGSCRGSRIPPSTPTCRGPLKAYGEDCNDEYDCESDLCSRATGMCSNTCTTDSDCTDGLHCVWGEISTMVRGRHCSTRSELGERCNQPNDCISGLCEGDNWEFKYCASSPAPTRLPTPAPTPAMTVTLTRPSTYTSFSISLGRYYSPEECAVQALDDDRCDGYEIMMSQGSGRRHCSCLEMPSNCPTDRRYRAGWSYDIYEYDNKECEPPSEPEGLNVIPNTEIRYGNYKMLGEHNLAHCIADARADDACIGNTVQWRANGEYCYCMTVSCNTSGAIRSSSSGYSFYQYEFCPTSSPTMPPTRSPTNAPGPEESEDTSDGGEVTNSPGKMPYSSMKYKGITTTADSCITAARNDGACNYQISWDSSTRQCYCNDSSSCPATVYNWSSYRTWTTYQYEAC